MERHRSIPLATASQTIPAPIAQQGAIRTHRGALMPAALWAAENGTGTEVAFGGQAKMVRQLSPASPASFPTQERPVLKLFWVDAMSPMRYREGRKMERDPHAH